MKYTNDGRPIEGGRLVTAKQDFVAHTDGTDWRHTADQINMNPPLSGGGGTYTDSTVQGTLAKLIESLSTGGQTLITIGDGYSAGDITIGDPGISTLQDALNEAFTFTRLQNGGVILIKASTYSLTQTVTVPVGITIIGEKSGTNIIAVTAEQPVFIFPKATGNFNIGDGYSTSPQYQNGLLNINLFDNLGGSEPSMSAVPMIQCTRGSNVIIDNCSIIGKLGTAASFRAIGYDGGVGFGSSLHVKNSFIDGVQTAIDFDNTEGSTDFLTVTNVRARTFGDKGIGDISNRAFVAFTVCNANFANNFHQGIASLWDAEACFLIKDVVVTNSTEVSLTMIGNAGGLGNTYAPVPTQFLVDDRTSPTDIPTADLGNTWGDHGGQLVDLQFFTTNNTWTKPSSGTFATIMCVGGGGGGGSNGGGGGGGQVTVRQIPLSSLASTATITIGAAGAAGAPGDGGTGGTSSFASGSNILITAAGGVGGISDGTNMNGGNGGGRIVFGVGGTTNGQAGSSGEAGGGGGGGDGATNAGGAGGAGYAGRGGAGGISGTATPGRGAFGYGGGGGGGLLTGGGGNPTGGGGGGSSGIAGASAGNGTAHVSTGNGGIGAPGAVLVIVQ